MIRNLSLLIGATFVLWGVLVYPGWLLWGEVAIWQSTAAMGLCLGPAAATLAWCSWKQASPEQLLVQVLGGSGIRLAFVLGLALFMYLNFPDIFTVSFWGWLLVFYFFTLTLEMVLLVRGRSRQQKTC